MDTKSKLNCTLNTKNSTTHFTKNNTTDNTNYHTTYFTNFAPKTCRGNTNRKVQLWLRHLKN
jgi:hypothetical protein